MKILTPVKAIRMKCLDCMAEQKKEVATCHIIDCSLWPYRMGHRPTNDEKTKVANIKEVDDDDEARPSTIKR